MTIYLVTGVNRLGEKFASEFKTPWGAKAAARIYKELFYSNVEVSEVMV